jgi:sulfonate transport system substrate-binding protein
LRSPSPAKGFGVGPLPDKVIADQQLVADTFHGLGLLPKKIVVADAVRRSGL